MYLIVVMVTSRGFIAAPLRRVLDGQVDRMLDEVDVFVARNPDDKVAVAAHKSLKSTLSGLKPDRSKRGRQRPWLWMVDSPLTQMYALQRQLNAVQRGLVDLVKDDALDGYAGPLLHQLSKVDAKAAQALTEKFEKTTDPEGKRYIIRYAHELLQSGKEKDLAVELEDQRIALWLAMVGLLGVLIIAFVTRQHQVSLLFGAVGGFLAPLVRISTGRRASSWGVMVLSPVGGALTAVGGLLLVRLLSDENINVLGQVFRDNSWDRPDSVLALALAVLFGFSGRLFSSLAIAGTSQLSPRDPGPAPTTG